MGKEKAPLIGARGLYTLRGDGGMAVEVELVDFKNSYGRNRWLIKPVAGTGEVWTEQDIFSK